MFQIAKHFKRLHYDSRISLTECRRYLVNRENNFSSFKNVYIYILKKNKKKKKIAILIKQYGIMVRLTTPTSLYLLILFYNLQY